MSSSGSSKPSRWGSLLQQAVAGVESRLDTILADSDETPARAAKSPERKPQQLARKENSSGVAQGLKAEDGPSRTRSNSRHSDRLQERLARAIAGKDNTRTGHSPAPSSDLPSRTASPALESQTTDTRLDATETAAKSSHDDGLPLQQSPPAAIEGQNDNEGSGADVKGDTGGQGLAPNQSLSVPIRTNGISSRTSLDSDISTGSVKSQSQEDQPVPTHDAQINTRDVPISASRASEDHEAELAQLRSDYETMETQRQEEVHLYSERIDALEAKLQYLAHDIAEDAKSRAASAASGSLERKVAQHEEKIALLMEEGEKLSSMELKHMSTIKKLRARVKQDEKAFSDLRTKTERAEKAASDLTQRVRQAEAAEKRSVDRLKTHSKLERELEAFKAASDSKDTLIASLRSQLAEARDKVTEDEKRAQTAALEVERKLVAELRDELSDARIEKELVQERAKAEMRELKERIEREKERARIAEEELRREQSVSESKLEALRARAEEAAMGTTGDAQAKLIRQVETLQTQYAVSSENWQRIEESLTSRVSGLEKERDELLRKENDARQKVRKSHLQARRAEEELEKCLGKLQATEQEMAELKLQLENVSRQAEQLEMALNNARTDLEREKRNWELDLARRVEQEKAKLQDGAGTNPVANSPARVDSPVAQLRKDGGSDLPNLQLRRQKGSNHPIEAPGSAFLSPSDRRPSLPIRTPDISTVSRQDSFGPMAQLPSRDAVPETPSIRTTDQDDPFESPSSPQQTINDMISVTTTGAGPSVQLVERMSATVRRLNSEKAATRDELGRLAAQRDDAREQIVALMREVEQKRAADDKANKLEAEVAQLNERYQTTLEMLGEKSELVEELRADIADMKNIYRDLLDKSMR